MKCPACSYLESKVIDSRLAKDGQLIRRRRECEECGHRFTTYERLEEQFPVVVKKDGRRESFDRSKIFAGMRKSCEKRPVSTKTIEEAVNRIERAVLDIGEEEIQGSEIGKLVMHELRQIDEVAYVRFASVYRSFRDVSEFMSELQEMIDKTK